MTLGADYDPWMVPDGILQKVLDEQLPDRFRREAPFGWDYPWHYGYHLVEAAVAVATFRGEPYAAGTPAVVEVVEDFIAQLRRPMEARVALVASDIRMPDLEPLVIDGVTMQAAPGGVEELMAGVLPRAGQLIDRQDAIALSHGHDEIDTTCLIYATNSGLRKHEELAPEARRRTRELLSAVRLVTGSTTAVLADIEGQPARVHPHGQWVRPQPHGWFGNMGSRLAAIDPAMVPLLTKVVDRLRRKVPEEGTSLDVALGRFNRVLNEPTRSFPDTVIDLLIGLEAAMTSGGRDEVSLRVRLHAAMLLSTDDDAASDIYQDVKVAYDLRSTVAHGGALNRKTLAKELRKVAATARAGDALGYRITLATDRWRDLLRRAILLRLALTDIPDTWPELPPEGWDVDKLLAAGKGDEWKRASTAYWGDVRTTGPASPLVGLIGTS